MLDYQKLKELNKQTYNLQKPYELEVMAIPRELWDAMVQYQTEIGKYLLQASDQIVKLPIWENITEELNPALGTMTTRIKDVSDRTTSRIVTELQTQMKDLRRELSSQMMELAEEREKKLKMRDLSPMKIKLK